MFVPQTKLGGYLRKLFFGKIVRNACNLMIMVEHIIILPETKLLLIW